MKGPDLLDAAGLERLIEHILSGGVHGLFVLGTTGEAPALDYRLRREVIERTCGQVGGRVPVLVGITDTSFAESVSLAGCTEQSGARAVVLSAPYYFPAAQSELLEYLQDLCRELPLPVSLYNAPGLDLSTIRMLQEQLPTLQPVLKPSFENRDGGPIYSGSPGRNAAPAAQVSGAGMRLLRPYGIHSENP